MKVVVVGTNQKDRERVARVIKDKYKGLVEDNAVLLKKLQRSNDAWIREREEVEKQIADKKVLLEGKEEQISSLKRNYEAKLDIECDNRINLEKQITALEGDNEILRNMGKISKASVEALAAGRDRLREVGEKLRDYLTESGGNERYSSVDIPDEIWIPFIEALRGEEEVKDVSDA